MKSQTKEKQVWEKESNVTMQMQEVRNLAVHEKERSPLPTHKENNWTKK
jgi:hypothetical protein